MKPTLNFASALKGCLAAAPPPPLKLANVPPPGWMHIRWRRPALDMTDPVVRFHQYFELDRDNTEAWVSVEEVAQVYPVHVMNGDVDVRALLTTTLGLEIVDAPVAVKQALGVKKKRVLEGCLGLQRKPRHANNHIVMEEGPAGVHAEYLEACYAEAEGILDRQILSRRLQAEMARVRRENATLGDLSPYYGVDVLEDYLADVHQQQCVLQQMQQLQQQQQATTTED